MSFRRVLAVAGIPSVAALFLQQKNGLISRMDGSSSHEKQNSNQPNNHKAGDAKIHSPVFGTVNTRSRPKTFKARQPQVTLDSLVLLSGSAHPKLAEDISNEVKVPLARATLSRFADGEVAVQIQDNVRGKVVFVIQSCAAPVNDSIMELLLTISCLRRADARRVIAVVPYFGYKHHRRGYPLSTKHSSRFLSSGAADFATMLQELGVDGVIAVDLQRPGQGHEACFFDNFVPVETSLTAEIFVDHLLKHNVLKNPITIVAPNAECFKKAKNFQNLLQKETTSNVKILPFFAADASSGPVDINALTTLSTSDWDLKGRDVIIVDDMVDTGETITSLSTRLKVAGAQEIFVCASHGLFTDLSSKVIDGSDLSKVFVLDTLPLPGKISSKVEEVSIAQHLAHVILTEHFRSISSIEEKFEIDD